MCPGRVSAPLHPERPRWRWPGLDSLRSSQDIDRTVQKAPGGLPAAPVCAGWRAPSPGNAFPSCTRGFGLSFCAALGSVTQTRPSWSTFLEARCCRFRTTQSSHGDGPPWLQLTLRKIEWMGCGSPRVSATVTVGADLLPGKLGAPSGVFAL